MTVGLGVRWIRWVSVAGVLGVAACASDDVDTARATTPSTGAPTTVFAEANAPFVRDIPPPVDLDEHSVPLDEVIFDTFDGRSVALTESTPEVRARVLDRIPPIDEPVYGGIEDGAWMQPGDIVLGYLGGEAPLAYPVKILNFHEIVNDDIGGVSVLISYCPLCASGVVYDRTVDGEVLSFSNTGALHESDMVMVDRQTGSYWWQVRGSAIVGSLTDSEMHTLPSEMSTWSSWVERHPDTLVLTRDTGFARNYERDSFAGYDDVVDSGRFAFPVGESANDSRLSPAELVVVVEVNGRAIAYAIAESAEEFDDNIDGQTIRIIPHEGGANVFLLDDYGTVRSQLPARASFWFSVVGAFPDVELRSAT